MSFDFGGIDWVTLGVVLAALAVGWVILKAVLRLTMRVFTVGCGCLLVLAAGVAAVAYFGS